MIQFEGIYLPDGETHLVEWMKTKNQRIEGRLTYQLDKQLAALSFVKNFRTAVDIGAHVGLWSVNLAPRFRYVYAFEPVLDHRECFALNVPYGNVVMHPVALGASDALIAITSAPTSSGDSYVDGAGDIPQNRLDDYALDEVDFLKLDCEGYELFALKGAQDTIDRCRPTICVEQKPGKAQRFGLGETDAVSWLETLGAKVRRVISGDYILSF